MSTAIPRDVLTRVKKLALLPEEVKQSRWGVPVTRLTILKSLCQEHEVTDRFVASLARRTRQKVEEKAKGPGYLSMEEWSRCRGNEPSWPMCAQAPGIGSAATGLTLRRSKLWCRPS